jgi:hypothetical protein
MALLACAAPVAEHPAVPEWHLSPEPTLILGSDSLPTHTLGSIAAVAGMPNGEIAIADGQAVEVRVFSATGEYLRTIARGGGGPGEFEVIGWMQPSGDSLLIHDGMRRAVTVLGVDGVPHRVVAPGIDSDRDFLALARRLSGGRWIGAEYNMQPSMTTPELNRDSVSFGLLGPDGVGPWVALGRTAGHAYVFMPATRSFGFARFHVSGIALPLGDRVVLIHPDTGTVRLFDASGREVGSFQAPLARQPLTTAMIAEALAADQAAARTEQSRARIAAFYEVEPKPTLLPMARSALGDGDDALWFEEFTLDLLAPQRFLVVGDDGRLLGTVAVPKGVRLLQVGPDWVLGSREDADGRPQVVRYGLTRS